MGSRIGVIGSSNIDLVTRVARMPAAGETLAALSFAIGHGGKGANQAVAAAKCGADVVFVTRVGGDAFGAELLDSYRDLGLDARFAAAVPQMATGTATILVESSGENRILIAAGANAALQPTDIDAAAAGLRDCALIVLQLEVPLATAYRALDWAAEAGIPVLLNPAPAQLDLDFPRLAKATFVAPNQTELSLISGRPAGTREEATAAAQALIGRGVRTVIVTLGAAGTLIVEGGGALHVPAPRVEPVDTTGAGDAFIGAFAAGWVARRDVAAAVEAAVRYAADTTTRPGAQASYGDGVVR